MDDVLIPRPNLLPLGIALHISSTWLRLYAKQGSCL